MKMIIKSQDYATITYPSRSINVLVKVGVSRFDDLGQILALVRLGAWVQAQERSHGPRDHLRFFHRNLSLGK
jgi:hypothetical protein